MDSTHSDSDAAASAASSAQAAASSSSALAAAAAAAPASSSSSSSSSAPLRNYLLHQYCHDDPKQLNDFRLAELDALCEVVGAGRPCYAVGEVRPTSAFIVANLPSDEHVARMAARAILVKQWAELWAQGDSVESCLQHLRQRRQAAQQDKEENSMHALASQASTVFDVRVVCVGDTMPAAQKAALRSSALEALSFSAAATPGHNSLDNGAAKLCLYIDVGTPVANPSRTVRRAFFARVIQDERGGQQSLEQRYRLSERRCLGPTSMPPALSFIMSNLALIRRGSLVLDPFVGTGSILVAAAHHRAMCLGADLDHKLLTGRTRKGPMTLRDNFVQYGFQQPEVLCADLKHSVWRKHPILDAIMCDPPYGVRAGARKLGRAAATDSSSNGSSNKKMKAEDGESAPSHYLATQAYEVDDIVADLLALASDLLRVGGRLVYWLPVPGDASRSHNNNLVVPSHPALRLVSVSEQAVRLAFNRCLICMEKIAPPTTTTTTTSSAAVSSDDARTAAASASAGAASSSTTAAASSSSAASVAPVLFPAPAAAVSINHAKRLAKVARRQEKKAAAASAKSASASSSSSSSASAAKADLACTPTAAGASTQPIANVQTSTSSIAK